MYEEEKKDLLCVYCGKRENIFFSWFVHKTRFNVCNNCWEKLNSNLSRAFTYTVWPTCVICREGKMLFFGYGREEFKNNVCIDCKCEMDHHYEMRIKVFKDEEDIEEMDMVCRVELYRSYTGEKKLKVIR